MKYDLLIKNGTIVDGKRPVFAGNVAVSDGKIAAVERCPGKREMS